jgi:hypothetical protein
MKSWFEWIEDEARVERLEILGEIGDNGGVAKTDRQRQLAKEMGLYENAAGEETKGSKAGTTSNSRVWASGSRQDVDKS